MAREGQLRELLLREVARFVVDAAKIRGVARIAIVGSLITEKPQPKDADMLITIDSSIDIDALAAAGRRLTGRTGSAGSGADVFLCSPDGTYLGRTCSFRDCHPRVSCLGYQCHRATRICDDFDVVRLSKALIKEPPLELWPTLVRREPIPEDVEQILVR